MRDDVKKSENRRNAHFTARWKSSRENDNEAKNALDGDVGLLIAVEDTLTMGIHQDYSCFLLRVQKLLWSRWYEIECNHSIMRKDLNLVEVDVRLSDYCVLFDYNC